MNEQHGHSDLSMAFAFLAGGLVGAAIAFLFAPKSGAEMRAEICEWTRQAQEKAAQTAEKIRGLSGHQQPTPPAEA